ncbi:MAG TPA: hypothetical protein VNW99_06845 [Cytophagaceae bacterium]|jgi:hypothetical protein|nr:hypothetical protein [Cytophagaceae bacterium]
MQIPVLLILNAVMALVYMGFGVYFIKFPRLIASLPPSTNAIIGILLIFYGLFRGYRAYKSFRKDA